LVSIVALDNFSRQELEVSVAFLKYFLAAQKVLICSFENNLHCELLEEFY
jgi:hypothetical protein